MLKLCPNRSSTRVGQIHTVLARPREHDYNAWMCRNIRPLFNFDPPASDAEIRSAAIQFVRKLSGFTRPSQANEAVFEHAVDDITSVARGLIDSLVTTTAPHDRAQWTAKMKARSAERFARPAQ
jgi:hypothetical protein